MEPTNAMALTMVIAQVSEHHTYMRAAQQMTVAPDPHPTYATRVAQLMILETWKELQMMMAIAATPGPVDN